MSHGILFSVKDFPPENDLQLTTLSAIEAAKKLMISNVSA
jgi:hypothetical protein